MGIVLDKLSGRQSRIRLMMETTQFGNEDSEFESSYPRPDSSATPTSRLSDWFNLVVMAAGVGILIAVAYNHDTATLTKSLAIAFSALAVIASWQIVRRNRFSNRMPIRWMEGERRVIWLRRVHTLVAVVGAVGYLGFIFVWISRPQAISRSAFPVLAFGYLIVQASFTGFFRDHLPVPTKSESGMRALFSDIEPIRSERWGSGS